MTAFDGDVDITVEIGFAATDWTDNTPTWTDISAFCRGVSTRRGRSDPVSAFDAGEATLTLDNRDGRFDPGNASSPYSPNVKFGLPVRIRATYNAVTYPVYRGYIERWPIEYPVMGKDSLLQVPCVDMFKLLATAPVSAALSQSRPDEWISTILTDLSVPSTLYDLAEGVALMAAYTPDEGDRALALMQLATDAEAGCLFVDRSGKVAFLDRLHLGGVSPSATFGTSGFKFRIVGVDYDDATLWNRAAVSRPDSDPQVHNDTASQALPGIRTIERTDVPLANDPGALNTAQWLVLLYTEERPRLLPLTIDPRREPTVWEHVLGRELRDTITVAFQPPGGGTAYNVEAAIEHISHDIAPKKWETTWELHVLADAETASYWRLGVSDDLGTDTIPA